MISMLVYLLLVNKLSMYLGKYRIAVVIVFRLMLQDVKIRIQPLP